MPGCTTTGTTWALCGHSIYQHHPTCKHPGSRCAKDSTLVSGTCPSCTQIAYWAPPVPPALPSHLSAKGIESTPVTPAKKVKVKEEPASSMRALDKVEVMDPDQYLRSEYEKHMKSLGIKSEDKCDVSKALSENVENERAKGEEIMKINGNNEVKEIFGGPSKEFDSGKEYFFEFHIKQLEEKLDQARLREAENNVEIRNLKARVEMLIIAQSVEHALSDSTPTRASETPGPTDRELSQMQKEKEALQSQLNDLKSQVSAAQANLQMQVHGQGQTSVQAGQSQVNGNQNNNTQRQVTPEIGYSKEKEAHIAAITFTSPIISLVTKLKSAISPSPLEEWFGKQVKYTFQCAGDGKFSKMVDGYKDFVEYIANEIHDEEEKVNDETLKMVLNECEDFVNVLFEVDNMLQ